MTGKTPSLRFAVVVVASGADGAAGKAAETRDAVAATRWPGAPGEVVEVDAAGGQWSDAAAAGMHGLEADGVAFLAAGARPRPEWLLAPARRLHHDRSIAALAPAIVPAGGDGAANRPAVRFDAMPMVVAGPPAAVGERDGGRGPGREVLYAPPPAVILSMANLRGAGGWRPGAGAIGAAVELGWRLWMLGWRVETCPASMVDVGSWTGEAAGGPPGGRLHADALRTVFTHYEDERQRLALPAAVAIARAAGADGQAAVAELDADRAVLLAARADLQRRRHRGDADLLRLFPEPVPDGIPGLTPDAAGRLRERWGSRHRIAIVTPDVVGVRMAGPAIRAWHMAGVLSGEHDVRLLATGGVADELPQGQAVESAGERELRQAEAWCDVMVVQGFVLRDFPFLRETTKIVVVDVYDPLHLEQLELTSDESDVDRCGATLVSTDVLNDQLAHGDFLLCASGKQRDFWLGQLAALGRINPRTYDDSPTLDRLLAVVPFGLPGEPPASPGPAVRGVVAGIEPGDDLVVWGGGIYNWFDPLTLVRAVDRLRHRRPQLRLYFMGMRHPGLAGDTTMAASTRTLAAGLGLVGSHVFFNEDWVPYEHRGSVLLEADVGVSTHFHHVETAFSFRTRILDYLWAGLPIVATRGDSFADLIEARGLGVTVDADDVDGLEEALHRVLADGDFRARCRQAVADTRQDFTWPVALAPLVEFCRSPRRAPDLVDPAMPIKRPVPAGQPPAAGPMAAATAAGLARVAGLARRAGSAVRARRRR